MLVKLTPKQIKKVREFLNTCKLNAYDIPIYNEIINSLDNPLDDKIDNTKYQSNKKVNNESYQPPIKPYEKPSYRPPIKTFEPTPQIKEEPIKEKNTEIVTQENLDNLISDISGEEVLPEKMIESAGMFGVIDRRTKSPSFTDKLKNKSDYV